MEQLKTITRRLVGINALTSVVLFVLCTAALVFVFVFDLLETIPAYIIYTFTTYSYVMLGFNFPKIIRNVKAVISKNKIGNRFITDISFRVKLSLYVSFSFNLLYAVFRLVASVLYSSYWFGAEAFFYIILCIIRFLLLRFVKKEDTDLQKEFRQYRICGVLLFVMNVALTGVLYQMIRQGQGYEYPGFLIFAAALFAFCCFISSAISIIAFRKYKSPVLSATRAINFAKALVAMFALQNAMFSSFGGEEDLLLENIMNIVFGIIFSLFIFGMSIFMVIRANRNLKKIDEIEEKNKNAETI
ncbi:MAG: hypothetical protein FWG70_08330 [Oscillospiraceae bacterium]|nr:hypothetical protein [Oscillospiraceae bacterium]